MGKKQYNILNLGRIPFRCAKGYSFLIALQKILDGIVPSIQILITAKFLDVAMRIANGKSNLLEIILPLILIGVFIAYTWLSSQIIKFVECKLEFKLRERFRVSITEKVAKLQYRHIENQETWDLISRVSKQPEIVFKKAYINTLSFLSMLLRIVGVLVILISQVWWAGLTILLISIPLVILAMKSGKETYDASREISKHRRRYEYLGEVLTGREGALERNLFGFTEEVNKKWKEQYEITRRVVFKADLKFFVKLKLGSIVTAIITILMTTVLIKPVLDNLMSVGMFISIVNGLFSLVQMMSWQLSEYVGELARNKEYLKDLGSFESLEELQGAVDLPSVSEFEVETLEFKKVSFKYPGTDYYILKDLSFKLEKGVHYAFVGANGAGKTTITKLIIGLYEEFEGDILINGTSIKDYKHSELKSLFSVVYQDFAKYYISMKDNISLGDVNHLGKEGEEESIKNSINIMGLEAAVEELPEKLNTPLGKIKSNGQDFSGGQWQRLAMARSIISKASLRILDEPTAALDPISESKIYEEFEKISKGGTTVFISHRLGSTKLAQKIFVLENGTIIEKGTHEELMEKGGVYEKMYESQRSWYL